MDFGDYVIDDDRDRLDYDAVWRYMSQDVTWGKWRTRPIVEQQFREAWRVVAVYRTSTSALVGCARALSDGISIAYLADVFVERQHRGRGLGEALLREMLEGGPGRDFKWMLHTHDTHGLYAKFGFAPPSPSFLERPSGFVAAAPDPVDDTSRR